MNNDRPQWNGDRERLKLAVEGDADGVRVPLPFFDRAQFQRFVADLRETLLSEGISDAAVMQIGPGTTGWSGNARRYLDFTQRGGTEKDWFQYGAWKPGTDTDFVIFSDYALVQAMQVMEHNPQIDVTHRVFNNGEAPTQADPAGKPGFANAPLGAKLLQLALRWNREIYGTANPPAGGFDFKLNGDINLTPLSPALEVYRGPDCTRQQLKKSEGVMIALEKTTLDFRFESDLPLAEMRPALKAATGEEWVFGDSEWFGDYLGGSITPEAVARIYSTRRRELFHVCLRFVISAAEFDGMAKLHQAERTLLDRILPAIYARNIVKSEPLGS